jgi:hypothetical protein
MPDSPFISCELDHRIALAQQRMEQGQIQAGTANRALMPWAAAEAWIVGHKGHHAISPRDGISRADHLCPLADTIAELTRARDSIARQVEAGQADKAERWHGIHNALRDLERLATLRAAFAAGARQKPLPAPSLPKPQPSLLADMFGPDGRPLPIERNAA